MQIAIFLLIAAIAVMVVAAYRRQTDRHIIGQEVAKRSGELLRISRAKRGSPFPDTGRGWWAWQVEWQDVSGKRTSWVLTDREGLKEWRD